MKAAGLTSKEFKLDEDAIRQIIRLYTREAGVRNLEREIANLARKAVKELMTENKKTVHINAKNLQKYAGVPRYSFGIAEQDDQVGVTTGLAWTEVGGEILSIEAVVSLLFFSNFATFSSCRLWADFIVSFASFIFTPP